MVPKDWATNDVSSADDRGTRRGPPSGFSFLSEKQNWLSPAYTWTDRNRTIQGTEGDEKSFRIQRNISTLVIFRSVNSSPAVYESSSRRRIDANRDTVVSWRETPRLSSRGREREYRFRRREVRSRPVSNHPVVVGKGKSPSTARSDVRERQRRLEPDCLDGPPWNVAGATVRARSPGG